MQFPGARAALALQHGHIHLALQRCCVKAVDHLGAGSGIAGQCQGVYTPAKQQPVHDAAVTQAVERARFVGGAQLEVRDFQHDLELLGQLLHGEVTRCRPG